MSQSPPERSAAEATLSFLAGGPCVPHRLLAEVLSREGMPLLCAVEAALARALPRPAAQELVWLSGAPDQGAHLLRLKAFGPEGELVAEAEHAFD